MKSSLIALFTIYVLIQEGTQTIKMSWSDGQPVEALMADRAKTHPTMTYQIVDKETFDSVPDPMQNVLQK